MKGIYLGAYKAQHPNHQIIYQDINGQRDLDGDMLAIDLTPYDFIICTPPCNYWSRANYRRETSEYAQKTKHLLPEMLRKLCFQTKPWIIENVRNDKMFAKHHLFDYPCFVYKVGRHTCWSNVKFIVWDIVQLPKTYIDANGKKHWRSSQHLDKKARQGGEEVHQVIERFLNTINKY